MNGSLRETVRGYSILGQLREGAFGAVYRATQPQVNREVAIKVIRPELASQPEFIRRFEVEARIVASLEHPHIVPLYDFWQDEGRAFLVMRLMSGNLADLLHARSLTLDEITRVIEQVASALAFAHGRGVIHRDLKPGNILLDDAGNAYLSDFGIAKETEKPEGVTMSGVILGSPGYISPEQVKSEPLSQQSDIYSLGILLYELVTGQHPFPDSPPGILLLKHVSETLPLLALKRPDFAAALDSVIQRATAKNRADRYPDVEGFLADYHQVIDRAAAVPAGVQTDFDEESEVLQNRILFLGGLHIEIGGIEIHHQLPAKSLALFVYLATTGKAHSRDALAALFWGDFPEDRARANLRDALAALRRTPLSDLVEINRRMVSFKPDALTYIDVPVFEQNLIHGRGLEADIEALEMAVDLYRGEFLHGFQVRKADLFDDWVVRQRRFLQAEIVKALQQLSEYHLNSENFDSANRFLHRLLSIEPWTEEAHRNLMLMMFLQGEYESALRQFKECEQVLAQELGVEPSLETRNLLKNIRAYKKEGIAKKGKFTENEVPGAGVYVPHELPNQLTPFIGREKEQRAIENVFKDQTVRLVTLLGVGGIGKTGLAIAIGNRQTRAIERDGSLRFRDGIYFVALEALEDAQDILPAISRAIDFQPVDEARAGRTVTEQLLSYLADKRMLLILDNFEQLLDGVGLLVEILQKTRDVSLLVTSREKLNLKGERLFSLGGLTYPEDEMVVEEVEAFEAEFDAPRLFLESARRLKPEFELHPDDIPVLIRLCQLVDGLPLAIELAAGWTDVLPVGVITSEIESKLTILESRYSDFPDRHRSMQAVFDVSWRQLSTAEQDMFSKLCVFHGGFTHQSAIDIIETDYRQLANLVSKSLAQYDEKAERYRVHPLLRSFGASRLAEKPAVDLDIRDRHSAYYCALLSEWNQWLKSDRQLEALLAFDYEAANALAAWNVALENDDVDRLEIAVDGLFRLCLWRRRFIEGEAISHIAERQLSNEPERKNEGDYRPRRQRLLARIKTWRSIFTAPANADQLLKEVFQILKHTELASLDTRIQLAMAYQRAGDLVFSKDPDKANQFYEKSLSLYEELGEISEVVKVLTQMGWEAVHYGNAEEARRLGEKALTLIRPTGDCKRTADILWLLGTLAIMQVDVIESTRLLIESVEIRENLGDHITDIMSGPIDLGMTLTWIGRFEEADLLRQEALALYKAQGSAEQIAWAHIRLATSKLHVGDFESVETHARIGLAHCREHKDHHGAGFALWLLTGNALIEEAYEDAEMYLKACLEALGSVPGSSEIAWAYGIGAEIAFQQGNIGVCNERLYKALDMASGAMGLIAVMIGLNTYCQLLFDRKRYDRSLEIAALLKRHPLLASRGFKVFAGERIEQLLKTLSPEKLRKIDQRGAQMDFYETAQEVIKELVEGDKI